MLERSAGALRLQVALAATCPFAVVQVTLMDQVLSQFMEALASTEV
jgi:hypothetical protein